MASAIARLDRFWKAHAGQFWRAPKLADFQCPIFTILGTGNTAKIGGKTRKRMATALYRATPFAREPLAARWFYTGIAILMLLTSVAGFAPAILNPAGRR